MKMVIALISKGQVDKIAKSLSSLGISGMTLFEVNCPADDKVRYKGIEAPYYKAKVKVEIAVNDDKVEQLLNIFSKGDADSDITADKICILNIEDSIRIRTGEKEEDAL